MRSLERITFLVAVACAIMSAGEVLAGPGGNGNQYVVCEKTSDGGGCTAATSGKACALNKTCSANASSTCTCI